MSTEEIKELLRLKGWSETKLASELGLTLHAVYKWLHVKNRSAPALASKVMREWLEEARRERKTVTA